VTFILRRAYIPPLQSCFSAARSANLSFVDLDKDGLGNKRGRLP
jgi:hypothetical protein